MTGETQEQEIPAGYDFVIRDKRAMAALNEYSAAIVAAEAACGLKLTEEFGLEESHAMSAMTTRLLLRAVCLACSTAIAYLGREPDPERWRKTTDMIFAAVAPEAKKVFADAGLGAVTGEAADV